MAAEINIYGLIYKTKMLNMQREVKIYLISTPGNLRVNRFPNDKVQEFVVFSLRNYLNPFMLNFFKVVLVNLILKFFYICSDTKRKIIKFVIISKFWQK
jgi:hypothetical protein